MATRSNLLSAEKGKGQFADFYFCPISFARTELLFSFRSFRPNVAILKAAIAGILHAGKTQLGTVR